MESRADDTSRRSVGPSGLMGLWVALLVWGIYLAIGATGLFSDTGMFRPIRSLIVLTCSALFLGGWYWIASRPRGIGRRGTGAEWNRASLFSGLVVLLGYTSWALARMGWHDPTTRGWTAPCGWTALVLFGIAAVAALVGLSDPRGRRGQLVGLLTLCLLVLAVLLFFIQVQLYVNQSQTARTPTYRESTLCRSDLHIPAFRLVST